MWEIWFDSKTQTWHVDTEAGINEDSHDATGEYQTKQTAIEAATLRGDTYIILRPENARPGRKPLPAAERMVQISAVVTPDQAAWLRSQPDGISRAVARAVALLMENR